MRERYAPILAALLLAAACTSGSPEEQAVACNDVFHLMHWRSLASLNEPREGNILLWSGGELITFGGHTTGFVASQTAEYYHRGKWHMMPPMTYTHDGAFAAQLPDGRIMLGGGSGDNFGIGQSWGVELYNPDERAFIPIEGIMDRKRAFASALALPDGRVVVSGNWYSDDAVSVWTEEDGFRELGPVSEHRMRPVILPGANGDVLIYTGSGAWASSALGVVDRLAGEAFTPELFRDWSVCAGFGCFIPDNFRIGGAFFFPVARKADGQVAIAELLDGEFSLLETDGPIPMTSPYGRPLEWNNIPLADARRNLLWLWGMDREGRLYFAKADLNARPAACNFYIAEGVEDGFPSMSSVALSPEGRLIFVGGIGENNFFPIADCWVFSDNPVPAPFPWRWVVIVLAFLACAGLGFFLSKKKARAPLPQPGKTALSLQERIAVLIEEEKLYLKKDLRLQDIASRLGTNVTYVSAAINGSNSGSFSEFVNGCRIRYAQELMKDHPEMPVSEVIDESGFASESAFYRHFKAVTGLTPGAWLASLRKR